MFSVKVYNSYCSSSTNARKMTTCRALEWEHKEPWTVTAEMGGDIASQKRKKKQGLERMNLNLSIFWGGTYVKIYLLSF